MKTSPNILGGILAGLLLAGCASPQGLARDLNLLMRQGQFTQAADLVEKSKESNYGVKNAFLFYLDKGLLLQLSTNYDESNRAFERAKQLAKDLFTKSVTTEASTFLISDNMRPYYGEDFERALIPLFGALNYLFLGLPEDAMVELRQVDALLTKLRTDYGYKNVYTEDAFARYLAGLIFENQGEINDAYISYWKALETYDLYRKNYGVSAPASLVRDALRCAKILGITEQMEEIKQRWGGETVTTPGPLPKGAGEVVVLHYNGLPPHKVDFFFEIGVGAGIPYIHAAKPEGKDKAQTEQAFAIARSVAADEIIRMAFPKYEPTPYTIQNMDVRAEGANTPHEAQVVEDVGAIAVKGLQDRIGRIRAKTIARSVVKYLLSRQISAQVEKKQGGAAGWLTKKLLAAASTATELADKRAWQTVPDKILMARVVLPAGERSIHVTFTDKNGSTVAEKDLTDIAVKPGKRTFVVVRTAQ